MKTIELLTAWERGALVEYITRPEARADYAHLLKVIKVLGILELSEDEKKEVGWADEPSFIACPKCQTPIQTSLDGVGRWDNTEMAWTLEFEDADFELLSGATTFQWPTQAARLLAPMLKKLSEVA